MVKNRSMQSLESRSTQHSGIHTWYWSQLLGDWPLSGILQIWPKEILRKYFMKADLPRRDFCISYHQKKLPTSGVTVPHQVGWNRMARRKSWEFSLTNLSFWSHTPAGRLWVGWDKFSFFWCAASKTIHKKQHSWHLSCSCLHEWEMWGGETDLDCWQWPGPGALLPKVVLRAVKTEGHPEHCVGVFATASERTKLCVCKERMLRIVILTLFCIQQGNQLHQVARKLGFASCQIRNLASTLVVMPQWIINLCALIQN